MHPNDGRVVSSFIAQALTNRPTTIFGGTQTRSFCYDDLVGGLMALMETADDVTGLINLGNPEEYRIRALAETIIEMSNSRSGLVFQPAAVGRPNVAATGYRACSRGAGVGAHYWVARWHNANNRVFRWSLRAGGAI